MTVISVPACTGRDVKPRRSSVVGDTALDHPLVVLPSAFLTSMWIHECGLIHSIFVTVPCSVIGLFASNSAANE